MSFASLPAELQFIIISECLRDDSEELSSLASFALQCGDCDLATGLSLAQVSRSCHAIITSLLYTHIRATTPSALRQLHSTLNSRPDLAEQVRSIHLGPEIDLPQKGWPLRVKRQQAEWPRIYLETTLLERDEEDNTLPRWCVPGARFRIDHRSGAEHKKSTCWDAAIARTVASALEELDVEPWRRGYSKSRKRIGTRAWASRLLMLQAALDLFLTEMRRVEDIGSYDTVSWRSSSSQPAPHYELLDRCKTGACRHYPQLVVVKSCSSHDNKPALSHNGAMLVSTLQLWQHVIRRGGPADHFDHFVHFSHSTRQDLTMTEAEWHDVCLELGGPHRKVFHEEDWLNATASTEESAQYYGRFIPKDDGSRGEYEEWAALGRAQDERWASEDVDHLADKVEDLIEAGRAILTQISNLDNLSVTSYFHRALSGLNDQNKLRRLSIAVKSRHWGNILPAGVTARLSSLTDLRICGMMSNEDADGVAWNMLKLERMLWEKTRPKKMPFALETIKRLQGRVDQAPGATAVKRKSQEQGEDPDEVKSQQHQQQSNRFTEVRIHPVHVNKTLRVGPSTDAGMAWQNGHRVPGMLHTVKVIERPDYVSSESRNWKGDDKLWMERYADAWEWWREGIVGFE